MSLDRARGCAHEKGTGPAPDAFCRDRPAVRSADEIAVRNGAQQLVGLDLAAAVGIGAVHGGAGGGGELVADFLVGIIAVAVLVRDGTELHFLCEDGCGQKGGGLGRVGVPDRQVTGGLVQ